jgi:hypothetical protein
MPYDVSKLKLMVVFPCVVILISFRDLVTLIRTELPNPLISELV